MGRGRSLRKECAEPGCKEYGHYTDLSRESYVRLAREVWRCVRHTRPEEVLSEANPRREVILENNQLPHGRYWAANSGFIYGPGFKAYADDFPAGTKIRVIAEIVYPTQETPAAPGIKIGDRVRLAIGTNTMLPTDGWTVYKLPSPEWRSYGVKHDNGGDMSINAEYVVPV